MTLSSLTYFPGFSGKIQPIHIDIMREKIIPKSSAQKFELKWSMIVLLSTLFVTLRFSINTRSENCFFGLFVLLLGFFCKMLICMNPWRKWGIFGNIYWTQIRWIIMWAGSYEPLVLWDPCLEGFMGDHWVWKLFLNQLLISSQYSYKIFFCTSYGMTIILGRG